MGRQSCTVPEVSLSLTMALLLLLVTTALLAFQPIEGQDRLAAITRLKESIVEAYPDKESPMLRVVEHFFVTGKAKSCLGDPCWDLGKYDCHCERDGCCDTAEWCPCKCKGNGTCTIHGEEELERIRDLLAKDKAHLDENSLGLLEEINEYFG